MFYLTQIEDEHVHEIIETVSRISLVEETGDRATINGLQSTNIRDHIVLNFLPWDFSSRTDWIHYIEYNVGGYQKRHKHEKHEKYSWILYLNDSDGDTIFFTEGKIRVTPRKGKLVIFSSDIEHEAMTTMMGKKVLVGGIDKID